MKLEYTKATREEATGTSYRGTIQTTLQHLIKIFGAPHHDEPFPDGKTQMEWAFRLEDGTIITIYDFKSGVNPEDETDWHVGGKILNATEESFVVDNKKILNWVTEKLEDE